MTFIKLLTKAWRYDRVWHRGLLFELSSLGIHGSLLKWVFFLPVVNTSVSCVWQCIFRMETRKCRDPSSYNQTLYFLQTTHLFTLKLGTQPDITWLVTFSRAKTKTIIFSRKRHKPTLPPLIFNDTHISTENEHFHHGLILSVDCRWKTHISTILTTAW